jgi:hypothetical protein
MPALLPGFKRKELEIRVMKHNTGQKKDQPSNENGYRKEPYAMLGAGDLTSALFKDGDERSGWRYRFNIFRMGKRNGRVGQWYSPEDVEDLVKLAQILAIALADDGCLEQDVCDDLSCLSACLDEVLPERNEQETRHPKLSEAVVSLLRRLLDVVFTIEERHFGANPGADHFYRTLLLLDRWLVGAISAEAAVLPDVDTDDVDGSLAGCPLCGKHDDCVNLGSYHWSLCRTHRLRWCVGHNLFVPEVYEDSVTYVENWQEIRNYRVVEPFRFTPKPLNSGNDNGEN